MERKALIVVGPQGSGNHMWSKILSLHKDVYGWNHTEYWHPHANEPFNNVWTAKEELKLDTNYNYFVTSCSIPFVHKGQHLKPKIERIISQFSRKYVKPIICYLSRDKNILEQQQNRVRYKKTYQHAISSLNWVSALYDINFLSYETLHLYGKVYLKKLQTNLDFPIDYENPKIQEIIGIDSNYKYIHDPGHQDLDLQVRKTYEEI